MEKNTTVISPLEAILVVAVTFVLFLFLGVAFLLAFGVGLALILGELLIMVVPLSYMLLKRIDVKRYIGLEIKPKVILLGIVSGIALLLIGAVASGVLTSIFGVSQAVEESNKIITDLSSSTLGLILVIIALSLAGICEEFTFRGFLQNTINRKYGFAPSLIVSALAFGLIHFDPQFVYMISASISGLVLGYIYHRWHSYVISAIAHSTVNLIALVTLLLIQ